MRSVATIPNLLSGFRLLLVPVLLVLSWHQRPGPVLVLYAVAVLTDMADGFLARQFKMTSSLGARLDTWADLSIYIATPACIWWLWPDVMEREAVFVAIAMASYILPILAALVKYGRVPCYHTWSAKVSAVLVAISAFLFFTRGPTWLFRVFTPVLVLTAVEQVVIIAVLPEWQADIHSVWHAIRNRRAGGKAIPGDGGKA